MIRKVKDKGDDKKIIHNANMLGPNMSKLMIFSI